MKIERAIEILDPEHREQYESIEPVNEACRMGMDVLRQLLSGEIAPVKYGHWVIDNADSTDGVPTIHWIEFHCSECKADFALEDGEYGWYAQDDIPFKACPLCGAQMKKPSKVVGYVIARPIAGCALNGNEYVLDANGDEMMFGTKLDAVEFLKSCGLSEDDIEKQGITFEEIEK